ncbi:SPOR domain-containing protein [Sagittula sp. S175]|uniref:SPOR domain-containing protein n=1 Tax=Sagittula sp. S175 TaxID=3415129 RepID=UPI003C7BE196
MSGKFPKGRILRAPLFLGALMMLSACADGQMPGFLQPKGEGEEVTRAASGLGSARTTERDVEAPEIFNAKEAGLWDGRPSLGGVWVAHPDVKEPERAIIRNTANGQYVIGALFRKERATPGPRLQVSSDAAAALGMLAGAPANLDVVALRREEVAVAPEAAAMPSDEMPVGDMATTALPASPEVSEGTLDPVLDGAAKALAPAAPAPAAASKPVQTAALAPVAAAPKPAAPKPASSKLAKPYLQIGIFSVEQNARNTATAMRQVGLVPTVKPGNSKDKPFWRVVVGPAQTAEERATLLKTIKGNGFEDAYAVTD